MLSSHTMQQKIIERLKEVYDPELPVNIYDLGLIYDIIWEEKTKVIKILMTLTTPSCPAAEIIPMNIKEALLALPSVKDVMITLTFDPPYTLDRLSSEARMLLGYGDTI